MSSLTKAVSQISRKTTGLDWERRQIPTVIGLIGAAVMGLAMKADWIGGAGGFGFQSNYLMLACGGFALLVSGMVLTSSASRQQVGEWILVGIAAFAVAVVSDLLPRFGQAPQRTHNAIGPVSAKVIMLAMVASGLALTRMRAMLPVEQTDIDQKRRLLLADSLQMGKLISLEVQLGFLVLLIRHFNLVSPVFCHQIIFLIFYGFLIHYFLSLRYRLPFFFLLSLAGIAFVFGFIQAGWLIGIGLTLIGLCHLPVSFALRVVILLLAGVGLAVFRAGWIHTPWANAIWPILASMFMFRLIAYMYSLKHHKAPTGVWPSLSYFFLLPNVAFPLFPVVDYATFHRTYYDADRHLIHQTGVKWILRGIVHLLLYRFIYYYLVIGPEDVNSVTNLCRYIVSNFLLILKLSGQFHLIVGVLHLFGFNLPETMNRYFLASSFTDFWRRVNIYWKDFMQRVLFYPLYFPLRNRAATAGLACATLIVFLATWALHSYQWFWLRGSFSFSAPDVMFWALFGVIVMINTLYDAKRGRDLEIAKHARDWRGIACRTFRITATFCVICVLWSLWISTSFSEWLSLWSVPGITWKDTVVLSLALIGALVLLVGAIATSQTENRNEPMTLGARPTQSVFFRSAVLSGGVILALFLVSQPVLYRHFGSAFGGLVVDLRTDHLNKPDLALLGRGYYENLTRVNRFNSQLWELYNKRPADWDTLADAKMVRPAETLLGRELRPSMTIIFHGNAFHTNRWGMRDKDYEMKPPPGTCRIALLGASPDMGLGVSDGQIFETLLEDRLNRANNRQRVAQYEILNFSVQTYSPLARLRVLETKVFSFDPDIVFYVAHPADRAILLDQLAPIITKGKALPYDYLTQVIRSASIEGSTNTTLVTRKLQPYSNDIISWTYRRIVELCRQRSITPVYIFVPGVSKLGDYGLKETANHLRRAKDAGFLIVDLSDLYENKDRKSLRIAEWDLHPNAIAHKLIADRLYKELKRNPALLQKVK
jgi:D-alanyl-lipoteichoic acid acyltransferase DltB (MBOAT superfamily)